MDYSEFIHQIAFNRIAPWGDDWRQAGEIAAAAANSNPHRSRNMTPQQYMPKPTRKPVRTQSKDAQAAVFSGLIALANAQKSKREGQHGG